MSAPPALDSSPPTLLCIDDQKPALKIRKIFLEAQGYKVLTASSGREGLALLKSNPVDAVILDYRMPPPKRRPKSAAILEESAEQVERSRRVVSQNLRRLEERRRVSRKP